MLDDLAPPEPDSAVEALLKAAKGMSQEAQRKEEEARYQAEARRDARERHDREAEDKRLEAVRHQRALDRRREEDEERRARLLARIMDPKELPSALERTWSQLSEAIAEDAPDWPKRLGIFIKHLPEGGWEALKGLKQSLVTAVEGWGNMSLDQLKELPAAIGDAFAAAKEEAVRMAELADKDPDKFAAEMGKKTGKAMAEAVVAKGAAKGTQAAGAGVRRVAGSRAGAGAAGGAASTEGAAARGATAGEGATARAGEPIARRTRPRNPDLDKGGVRDSPQKARLDQIDEAFDVAKRGRDKGLNPSINVEGDPIVTTNPRPAFSPKDAKLLREGPPPEPLTPSGEARIGKAQADLRAALDRAAAERGAMKPPAASGPPEPPTVVAPKAPAPAAPPAGASSFDDPVPPAQPVLRPPEPPTPVDRSARTQIAWPERAEAVGDFRSAPTERMPAPSRPSVPEAGATQKASPVDFREIKGGTQTRGGGPRADQTVVETPGASKTRVEPPPAAAGDTVVETPGMSRTRIEPPPAAAAESATEAAARQARHARQAAEVGEEVRGRAARRPAVPEPEPPKPGEYGASPEPPDLRDAPTQVMGGD